MSIFNENDRKLRKIYKIVDKIEALADKYAQMSEKELRSQTELFRKRLKEGETLDDILPEAFATVREASTRVLGLRHFRVQLVGGVALHQGRIAEMATGEGKTLVATLPAYLNALTGKGVHVVTVNDYLATRDANWMGNVYKFLGLTVGIVVNERGRKQDPGTSKLLAERRKAAYDSDITYGTNNEFGFDFLRDNMALRKADKVQVRGLNYALIDEVDSILIDEARTPLIISGQSGKSGELYIKAKLFADECKEDGEDKDFEIDEKEKSIVLTDAGIAHAERFFGVYNLSGGDAGDVELGTDSMNEVMKNTELNNHIQQALKAKFMLKKDKDYIVSDGEVLIVDEFTGRIMIGRRYSEGLHQAIEAKEGLDVRSESKTLATITLQNYFRMYNKLSGMTGTAKTEEEEFKGIYALDVVTIPTNLPCVRKDEQDVLYTKNADKITAIVEDIIEHHKLKQPILVGTVSVEKSEELSRILKSKNIIHNVLNAKNHKDEAEIIAQAGRLGAVTIATNMAGRGTDIMLGGNPEYQARKLLSSEYPAEIVELAATPYEEKDPVAQEAQKKYLHHYQAFKARTDEEKKQVIALGGLRIIGTERHESRRIDNQLRGRAGRQGDPGSSVFYLSLEDDILRIYGGDRMKSIADSLGMPNDVPIKSPILTKGIERAQRSVEGRNYSIRKQVLSFDDVMNAQREIIYKERGKVLDGLDLNEQIMDMVEERITDIVMAYTNNYKTDYTTWDYDAFNAKLEDSGYVAEGRHLMTPDLCSCYDVKILKDEIMKCAREQYAEKEAFFVSTGRDMRELERFVLLKTVDKYWIEHIDAMDALRRGIGLRGYGQRDPVIAYRQEGWDMFDDMVQNIHFATADTLFRIVPTKEQYEKAQAEEKAREAIAAARRAHSSQSQQRPAQKRPTPQKVAPVRNDGKVGRNDPCPCGSGLKYKNCCGKNQ